MRTILSLNEGWRFIRQDAGLPAALPTDWQTIDLPHTWNAQDGNDGKGGYYRGACWYARTLAVEKPVAGRVYLEIPAASQSARVYLNGTELAYHEGGYAAFRVDLTGALRPAGTDLLAVCVDNTERSNIYPQMADFTFYGGLYRGASLILTEATHFAMEDGADSLRVTAKPMEGGAVLTLSAAAQDPAEKDRVCYRILDGAGETVAETWRPATAPDATLFLPDAHLWQGVEDPYLYTCMASLVRDNDTLDELGARFGIREYRVDPAQGFFLNGKAMLLRGVSRHQDQAGKGCALTRADHYRDAALIRELGANTVRLAHYQHSRDFYDACDEYGFVVWAEIPYISCQSDDPAAHENCRSQMRELIRQNVNHPSICFWGLSNEITIAGEKPGLVENHKDLNALVKALDPTRLTTIAHVSMLPGESALHGITDVESYNHYFGWYGGQYTDNETWLDEYHARYPNRCLGLSEYGAEGILTYQTNAPRCRDYSESYQAEYHEHMAAILMARPYLWSTHVWNMFDFGCAARDEGGVAGRNNKGLVSFDRKTKKDAFYIYKAYWCADPFVHLCGRRYAQRPGDATTVKVYSNQPVVTLRVNGTVFAVQAGSKVFTFENVPLGEGFTQITAEAETCKDSMALERVAEQPAGYTLVEEDDEAEGAGNWFDQAATVDANAPLQFPEGCFSVKDKIGDIMENDEAYRVLAGALAAMTGMKLKKSMLGMMRGKTLEDLAHMGGGKNVPPDAIQRINAALCAIKK